MDKEFVDKLNSISEWKKQDDGHDQSEYSLSFHESEEGLVRFSSEKGEIIHRLKPLQELFFSGKADSTVIKWDDPRYLRLLMTIEGAIKRMYQADAELADSSVMLALDKLAVKPETVSNDAVLRRINHELRVALSMSDYSRDEVKMAVRKILASVKRHNALAGARGYLDFIMEYVP